MMRGDQMDDVTRTEVNRLIAEAIANERRKSKDELKRAFKGMLEDFIEQFRAGTTADIERVMTTWSAQIAELNRAVAELRRIQGAPLDKPLPPPSHAH
jgi:hypothetical protein